MRSDARAISSDPHIVVALTTLPDLAAAEAVGRDLVAEGLAACANVVAGVTSIFRWKGALEREREVLVVFKTTGERLEALRSRLIDLHPYDVPEFIALNVEGGHPPYLEWVAEEVARGV